RAEEDARQSVVVLGRDRIKLVVVTARAGQRQAEEGPPDHVDLVVGDVRQQLFLVGVAPAPVADRQHARGDDTGNVNLVWVRGRNQVAGDLMNDELVIGQ